MTSAQRRERPPTAGSRAYRWLLVLPFIWQVALVPMVNDVSFAPFNVPFPMLWQMLGVIATTAVVGLVFRLDRRSGVDAEEREFIASTQPAVRSPHADGDAS
ncbi:DUF3311 domain-containing protein [Actinoallomurus sp. CA-150999]|uniref:DUF3311 domain-containing protein n=1 Tax=Actinoallomurus sp. CA-150999 TaxID=3239887 RepID=UPI003D9463EE